MDANYWESRKDLSYYKVALDYVKKFSESKDGGKIKLLDVGAATQFGCQYLNELPSSLFEKTTIELPPNRGIRLPCTAHLFGNFLDHKFEESFDVVMCLQTLEHLSQAKRAAEKLFSLAPVVVVSVPYMWKKGRTASHKHDPIDEVKMKRWTKRNPHRQQVVDNRLVQVYL